MKKLLSIILLTFLLIQNSHAEDLSDLISPETFIIDYKDLNTEQINSSMQAKKDVVPVLGKDWMIVTANSFASAAGAKILEEGGTAADAMIAAQSVLGLVEPESSGLGGGSFLIWYDNKTNTVTTLDGRETAPRTSYTTQFQNESGETKKFFDAVIGGLSVGTPGTPALMFKAHEKWGKMKWSNLFTTAINLGENGFPVSKKLASSIERDSDRLKKSSQTSKYFLPDGNNLKYKQIITNRAYAETLKKISTDGIEDFYKGEIADDVVNTVQNYSENPGYLEKSDLENYNVIERDPVCISYREHNVCGMGPPSSGGVAVAQILKILEEFNLKSLGYEDPKSWQVIGDASRLAFGPSSMSYLPHRLIAWGKDTDCCTFISQSIREIRWFATNPMMLLPPGDPVMYIGFPSFKTIVGDIEDRGRLPGSNLLEINFPSISSRKEKSVSWLFSRNPLSVNNLDPKAFSIEEVIDNAFPYLS